MSTLYTIGHSTRSSAEVIALLEEYSIRTLVDVRRYPGSRRHPHFSRESLAASLDSIGIRYVHEPDLGGRRTARKDSPNTAWRAAGFRGYADYTATEPFRSALARLVSVGTTAVTAIMCAEAVPWRCHRQLIADQLVSRGWRVVHILGPHRAREHQLNPNARARPDRTIVYPAADSEQTDLWRVTGD